MARAYLALGSNLGDRLGHLQAAIDGLAAAPHVRVVAVSRVYETDPVGPDQPDYLNAVVALDADLDARALLTLGQSLEETASRVRAGRWGPRTLDVDLLLVGNDRLDEPDLVLPHPRMSERGFVLAPLRDIAPELVAADAAWPGVRSTDLHLRLPSP